jgi:hypothetical protein
MGTGEVRWDLLLPTTSGEGTRARTAREGTGTRTTRRAAADPEEGMVLTGVAALRGEEVRPGAVGRTEATAAPGENECYIKRGLKMCVKVFIVKNDICIHLSLIVPQY